MRGLKTRGIDKNELCVIGIVYAGDAVARGLRLARSDADFLADQRVQQRGFADIGLADDGNCAAALRACAAAQLPSSASPMSATVPQRCGPALVSVLSVIADAP